MLAQLIGILDAPQTGLISSLVAFVQAEELGFRCDGKPPLIFLSLSVFV